MSVSTLTSDIKTRVQTVATAYSELGYANDITKNTFKGNYKRFAVLPKGSSQSNSVTRYITLEQEFEIILTDGFINKALSDSEQQSRVIALQDLLVSVYKDLVNTRCGSVACINVTNLSIREPQFLEDNVVVQSATFNVLYRTPL